MVQYKSLAAAFVAAPILFGAGACAWAAAASPVFVPATPAAAAPSPPRAGDAQAKALFENACGSCHDAGVVAQMHQTSAQWANTVDVMVSRGAPLDPKEAAEISDYLAKHYG